MTGRHKFSELEARVSKTRQARIDRLTGILGRDMDLAQLHAARQRSQAELGKIPHVEQPAIDELEKRAAGKIVC